MRDTPGISFVQFIGWAVARRLSRLIGEQAAQLPMRFSTNERTQGRDLGWLVAGGVAGIPVRLQRQLVADPPPFHRVPFS